MPDIDVMDMTWIGAPRTSVARALARTSDWQRWWPDLDLALYQWRGPQGVRWTVRSGRGGRVSGSMEIYLHPADGGTLAYYFLRLDFHRKPGSSRPVPSWQRSRMVRSYRIQAKRVLWGVADRLDPDRVARVAAPVQRPRR